MSGKFSDNEVSIGTAAGAFAWEPVVRNRVEANASNFFKRKRRYDAIGSLSVRTINEDRRVRLSREAGSERRAHLERFQRIPTSSFLLLFHELRQCFQQLLVVFRDRGLRFPDAF